ncbi:GlxA family transcriptional regulator [Nonomuraea endophytica]|uniref:Transcriptional regulator GlxA family with amidase domain n=1 Tax=Nonomuraea endophytica TaxID=714136 RepID=A0A7W8AET3_9ACTN|nr:DJ-1/PfpI family protein [Nonomuraea endophytica]MBB5084793.1 transcriptional regulator GlxA family with amidase domain [Nonomuraea endophytica]
MVFLAFEGMKQLDVAGPAEVFAEAARLGAPYELAYVSSTGDPVGTSIGTRVEVGGIAERVAHADTVIIPGGDALPTAPISAELRAATAHLTSVADRVASVCTGAFLLASVGALDGRRATTHWAHAALLARICPSAEVIPDALFVHDGKVHSSAGVSSGIDLALALVEADHGPELAREVAQQLVVYMRRPGGQSQFSTMLRVSPSSQAGVKRVVDAVSARPAAPYDMAGLAMIAGVSPRHLARLFEAEIGMSPVKFVEQVRLETAKVLLLRGESVAVTTQRAGFQNAETMRRVFVSRLGMPPSVYQQRFATTTRAV